MNDDFNRVLFFPSEHVSAALLVSLLSVWVLVGLFHYLNLYTRRRYFSIWTASWLFYALWLTLTIRQQNVPGDQVLEVLKHWCISAAAVCLLWGSACLLEMRARQMLMGLFLVFLLVWSFVGVTFFDNPLQVQYPMFGLIGLASMVCGWSFYRLSRQRTYVGAGLLSFGFFQWGAYLVAYPWIQQSKYLVGTGFLISGVLQLFIAVSMIVLVLEEARSQMERVLQQVQTQKQESQDLQSRVISSEGRYLTLFDQASEGIIIVEASSLRIMDLNQAAERLLGIQRAALGQQALPDLIEHGHTACPAGTRGKEWIAWIQTHRHSNVVRSDGTVVPVEIHGAPVQDQGYPACQFFIRELTEQVRLEQQLRQAEKLSALGRMISGIAHELNNPLAIIKGYLELILSHHELRDLTRNDLQKVAQESDRATKLVSQFLSFARQQPTPRQSVNPNELLGRLAVLHQLELEQAQVELHLDLGSPLPAVLGDPNQLQQVFVNLVANAIQAMSSCPAPHVLTLRSQRLDGMIQILVQDNGPGVPSHLVNRIFEPFFTTKDVGKGTGLGLSLAHNIVQDHQGRIYYQPVAGGGAGFVVELPVLDNPVPAEPMNPTDDNTAAAKLADSLPPAKVLVLDDESGLAELLGELMVTIGLTPTVCCNTQQALAFVEERDFDLIFSDIRMPMMDGKQFYQLVTENKPYLARRFVFITGDVCTDETNAFFRTTGSAHLSKPFQLTKLMEVAATVLRENPPIASSFPKPAAGAASCRG
jgi:PAS domain S-box-containing protein